MLTALRILGKTWTIKDDSKTLRKAQLYGLCDEASQQICVRTDIHPEQLADTLLHEAIHAISFTLGLKLKEETVRSLTASILALFRDNPELTEILCDNTTA